MGKFEGLKEKTRVSAKDNSKSFHAAAAAVAKLKITTSLRCKEDLLGEMEKDYRLIANILIAAQMSRQSRRLANHRREVTGAVTALAYFSILFHLNFFEPNFFGLSREVKLQNCLRQMTTLFRQKNRDYGNSFRFWGIPGLLVRLGDKIFRLRQLAAHGYQRQVKEERLPDTALDLANYALMLLMLLSEGRSMKLGE